MLQGVPSEISGVTTHQVEVFGDETGNAKHYSMSSSLIETFETNNEACTS